MQKCVNLIDNKSELCFLCKWYHSYIHLLYNNILHNNEIKKKI